MQLLLRLGRKVESLSFLVRQSVDSKNFVLDTFVCFLFNLLQFLSLLLM